MTPTNDNNEVTVTHYPPHAACQFTILEGPGKEAEFSIAIMMAQEISPSSEEHSKTMHYLPPHLKVHQQNHQSSQITSDRRHVHASSDISGSPKVGKERYETKAWSRSSNIVSSSAHDTDCNSVNNHHHRSSPTFQTPQKTNAFSTSSNTSSVATDAIAASATKPLLCSSSPYYNNSNQQSSLSPMTPTTPAMLQNSTFKRCSQLLDDELSSVLQDVHRLDHKIERMNCENSMDDSCLDEVLDVKSVDEKEESIMFSSSATVSKSSEETTTSTAYGSSSSQKVMEYHEPQKGGADLELQTRNGLFTDDALFDNEGKKEALLDVTPLAPKQLYRSRSNELDLSWPRIDNDDSQSSSSSDLSLVEAERQAAVAAAISANSTSSMSPSVAAGIVKGWLELPGIKSDLSTEISTSKQYAPSTNENNDIAAQSNDLPQRKNSLNFMDGMFKRMKSSITDSHKKKQSNPSTVEKKIPKINEQNSNDQSDLKAHLKGQTVEEKHQLNAHVSQLEQMTLEREQLLTMVAEMRRKLEYLTKDRDSLVVERDASVKSSRKYKSERQVLSKEVFQLEEEMQISLRLVHDVQEISAPKEEEVNGLRELLKNREAAMNDLQLALASKE
eukprot:CAMPEP_0172319946 /NCGR_PEP_ID=MMETSP1058-20130122/39123_1 /TAXON_ID=83371 /ORGANISM="Detonula confervacea, Strain CCMP 353" /LENGTH=614 /DNA_ID=CAMNT_0013035095 /DNA_START=25 /DNA_END=1867 /DNA_ORIENTATION=-